MPLVEKQFFVRAVTNIAQLGDTDIFPFPIENHVLHDELDGVADLLGAIAGNFTTELQARPPISHSALAPAGYNGFRWATQIDPLWNAYMLGVVLSLAEGIERARIPESDEVVFSYRFRPGAEAALFDREGWSKFQARTRELTELSGIEHVVVVDIADFYSRIYHHRVENELKYIDVNGERARQVVSLLKAFSGGVSYGLPVGGPAARILSELLLTSIDRLLVAHLPEIMFVRYADDYRFFVGDLGSAHRAIGFLTERLQRTKASAYNAARLEL